MEKFYGGTDMVEIGGVFSGEKNCTLGRKMESFYGIQGTFPGFAIGPDLQGHLSGVLV